jgi:hypothetical protein
MIRLRVIRQWIFPREPRLKICRMIGLVHFAERRKKRISPWINAFIRLKILNNWQAVSSGGILHRMMKLCQSATFSNYSLKTIQYH